MANLTPIIFELDEELKPGEEMTGIQTVGFQEGNRRLIGYVAIIKNFNGRGNLRYGNLKAIKYDKSKFNNKVI